MISIALKDIQTEKYSSYGMVKTDYRRGIKAGMLKVGSVPAKHFNY